MGGFCYKRKEPEKKLDEKNEGLNQEPSLVVHVEGISQMESSQLKHSSTHGPMLKNHTNGKFCSPPSLKKHKI